MKSLKSLMGWWAFLGLALVAGKGMAQDATFSQFYASQLYLNPSLAGTEKEVMGTLNHRNQWSSIVDPYVTSQLSAVVPYYNRDVRRKHIGGFGVSIYRDQAGSASLRTLGANLSLAYNLHLTDDESQGLSFGMQAGIVQKRIDANALQWGEQFNPFVGFDASIESGEYTFNQTSFYPDFSAGIVYYYDGNQTKSYHQQRDKLSWFVGASAYHLNRPNESLFDDQKSNLPVLWHFHGGMDLPVSNSFTLSPNLLVNLQNQMNQVNMGLYGTYTLPIKVMDPFTPNQLLAGCWYRLEDSFIFMAGIGGKAYTFGFSYDLNTSNLRYNTKGRGAYEFSLTLRRVNDRKMKRIATPRM